MSQQENKGHKKWKKWLIRLSPLILLVLLYLVGKSYVGSLLEENGIAYRSLSLGGKKITVEGLTIDNPRISLHSERVNLSWNWKEVLSSDEDTWANRFMSSVTTISISDLQAVYDSSDISLNQIRINGINYGESIVIDSLFLDSLILNTAFYPADTSEQQTNDLKSTLDSLLDLNIRHFNVRRSGFQINSGESIYSANSLFLDIRDIDTKDPLGLSMDSLYVVYADTLELSSGFKKGIIDENLVALLNELNLATSGLDLNITAEYQLEGETAFKVNLLPSTFTFNWLRTFYPQIDRYLNPGIPGSTRISIESDIVFQGKQIEAEMLKLSFLETTIQGHGYHNWSGEYGDFKWNLTSLTSTREKLNQILTPIEVYKHFNWPRELDLSAVYAGKYGVWDTQLVLKSSEGDINIKAGLDMKPEFPRIEIQEFRTRNLFPDNILIDMTTGVKNVSLSSSALIESSDIISAKLQLINAQYEGEVIKDLRGNYSKKGNVHDVSLTANQSWLNLDLESQIVQADTIEVDLELFTHIDPSRFGADTLLTGLTSKFTATAFYKGSEYLETDIYFDSLHLSLANSEVYDFYNSNASYSFREDINQLSISLEKGQSFSMEWIDFIEPYDILQVEESIYSLSLNLWSDSDSVSYSISDDLNLKAKADTLQISKKEGSWMADLQAEYLRINDYEINKLSYSLNQGKDNGILKFTGLSGLPQTIENFELAHDFLKEDLLNLQISANVEGDSNRITLPLALDLSKDPYFFGILPGNQLSYSDFSFMIPKRSGIEISHDYNPLSAQLYFEEVDGEMKAEADYNFTEDIPLLNLEWEDFNFKSITPLLKLDSILLQGKSSGELEIIPSDIYSSQGIVTLNQIKFKPPSFTDTLELLDNKLNLQSGKLTLDNFIIRNTKRDSLLFHASINFKDSIFFNTNITTAGFKLLDIPRYEENLSGDIEIDTELRLAGNSNLLSVDGDLSINSGSSIYYIPSSDTEGVKANEVVIFVDYSDTTQVENIDNATTNSFTVNWNVDVDVEYLEAEVLFSPENQEFLDIDLSGNLELSSGTTPYPLAYGKVSGSNGRAYYRPPAVPDVNLIIESLDLTWEGDLGNPTINLKGYETMKVDASTLSYRFSEMGLEDFQVKLDIPEKKLNNLDLVFDVGASNSEINSYLSSLPPDTRSKYAFSLLTFGKFDFRDASTTTYTLLANKMNELAHRNIKNVDVYFASNTREGEDKMVEDLSYNLSKSFGQDKLVFSIQGVLQTGQEVEEEQLHWIDDIEIDYLLKKSPWIAIRGARRNNYQGAIDGEVIETSIGFHLSHSFRKLFGSNKSK